MAGKTRAGSASAWAAETASAAARTGSAAGTTRAAAWTAATGGLGRRFAREQAFTLRTLACELARPAHSLGFLARFLFGGLLVVVAELHLAENALALHLLLERLESLVDVVVANENLHAVLSLVVDDGAKQKTPLPVISQRGGHLHKGFQMLIYQTPVKKSTGL